MSRVGRNVELLAKLMLAEAESEGLQGMKLIGRIVENRRASMCPDYKKLRTIEQVITQRHRGVPEFSSLRHFPKIRTATRPEVVRIAEEIVRGVPHGREVRKSIWFYNPGPGRPCPSTQPRTKGSTLLTPPPPLRGRFGQHCFYTYLCTHCPHYCR